MARTEFCDVGGHCQEIYQALIGSKLSSIVSINQISYEATFSQNKFLIFQYTYKFTEDQQFRNPWKSCKCSNKTLNFKKCLAQL